MILLPFSLSLLSSILLSSNSSIPLSLLLPLLYLLSSHSPLSPSLYSSVSAIPSLYSSTPSTLSHSLYSSLHSFLTLLCPPLSNSLSPLSPLSTPPRPPPLCPSLYFYSLLSSTPSLYTLLPLPSMPFSPFLLSSVPNLPIFLYHPISSFCPSLSCMTLCQFSSPTVTHTAVTTLLCLTPSFIYPHLLYDPLSYLSLLSPVLLSLLFSLSPLSL